MSDVSNYNKRDQEIAKNLFAGQKNYSDLYTKLGGVALSPPEFEAVNLALANSQDPETEAYKWASAMVYSREFGIPLASVMPNLDSFNKAWLGREFKPAQSNLDSIRNSFRTMELQLDQARVVQAWREKGGSDPELERQIDDYTKQIESMRDDVPRNFFVKALKAGASVVPYIVDVASEGAFLGLGVAAALTGTAAAAGAYASGAGAAVGAAVTPAVIAAWAGAASSARSFIESVGIMRSFEYLKLRQAGVAHDVANGVSFASAYVQAGIEQALGGLAQGLGTVLRGASGAAANEVKRTLAQRATDAVYKKLVLSGKLGAVGKGFARYLSGAVEEGLEEALQELVSAASLETAAFLQGEGVETPDAGQVIKDAMASAVEGFRASLVLGIPGAMVETHLDRQDADTIRSMAGKIESKAAFVEAVKDMKPESMSSEEWTETMGTVFDNAKAGPELATIDLEGIDTDAEEIATKAYTAEVRMPTGELYSHGSHTKTERSDGRMRTRELFGNPETGAAYGFVEYNQGEDGAIEIEGVKTKPGYGHLQKDIVHQFLEKFPDTQIDWNPIAASQKEIRSALLSENPAGETLTYATKKAPQTEQKATAKLNAALIKHFPKMDSRERAAGIELVRLAAEKEGSTADEWIKTRFADEIIAPLPEDARQIAHAQGKTPKGAMTILADAKAIIYATENSDFSTWIHELAHVFRKNLGEDLLQQAEAAFGVEGGKWTQAQEERFAVGFEEYLRTGKAESSSLKALFAKMAAWLQRIYKQIASRVDVSPQIKAVYDELLGLKDNGLKVADREQKASSTRELVDEEYYIYQPENADEFFERRNTKLRDKLVDDMTPEEKDQALLLHELTMIPNRRAYAEDKKRDGLWPVQVSLDADSLKWVNDNMGHKSGDKMLERIATAGDKAAQKHGVRFYHVSGDEFIAQAQDLESALKWKNELDNALKDATLESKVGEYDARMEGLRISAGFDDQGNLEAADTQLEREKLRRESEGSRSPRGELPPNAVLVDREGRDMPFAHANAYVKALEESRKSNRERELAEGGDTPLSPRNIAAMRNLLADAQGIDPQYLFQGLNEAVDKLVKMEPLPITTTSVPDHKRGTWAKQHLGGIEINEDSGNKIELVRSSGKKAASHSADKEILEILPSIREIIKKAIFITKEENQKLAQKPNLKAINHYAALINKSGHLRLVTLSTNIENNKEILEKLDNWEIEKRKAEPDRHEAGGTAFLVGEPHDNKIVQLMRGVNNPNFLFQDDNPHISDALYQLSEEENLENARSFDSWEAWKADAESFAMFGDTAAPEGLQGAELDAWYKDSWEKAKGLGKYVTEETTRQLSEEEEEGRDARFLSMVKGKLDRILKDFAEALYVDLAGATEEDAEYNERALALQRRIRIELPPVVQTNAQRVLNGDPLSPAARKAVMTNMTRNARGYRSLYAAISGDKSLEVTRDSFGKVQIEESVAEKWDRMSFEERNRYARKVTNAEVARKIASGKIQVGAEVENYIKSLQEEERALEKKIAEQKEELDDDFSRLSQADKYIARLSKDLAAKEREYKNLERDLAEKKTQHATKTKQLREAWDRLAEAREAYQDALHGAREEARLQTRLAKERAVEETREKIEARHAEIQAMKDYRERMIKLAQGIMAKVSDNVAWEQREQIEAIQALLDPHFRRAVPQWIKDIPIIELHDKWEKFPQILEKIMPKGALDRLNKRPLNEWTEAELGEVAEKVADLRAEGRVALAEEKARRKRAAIRQQSAMLSSIVGAHGAPALPPVGSAEEKRRKTSKKAGLLAAYQATVDTKRKAMMIDGDQKGAAYDLLIRKKRERYRAEQEAIERRKGRVMDALERSKIKLPELYETHTIKGASPTGEATFTVSDLLYVYLGSREEKSRDAIAYGVLCNQDERQLVEDGKVDRKVLEAAGQKRLAAVLAVANKLPTKYLAFAETISRDFTEEFERINEVAIREFNQGVSRVKTYVPMQRLEIQGDNLAEAVADDLLNKGAGGLQRSIEKGFSKNRITIAPEHQKPIRLDLFGTWDRAVDMQEHFIAFAEYGRELNRVFKSNYSGQLRAYIEATFGQRFLADIHDYLNEVVNPQSFRTLSESGKLLRAFRGQLAPAYLGWKLSSVVKQLVTSPLPFMQYVNPAAYAAEALKMAANPLKYWEEVAEKSVIMRERKMDPVLALLAEQQAKVSTNKLDRGWKRAQSLGMKGLEWADRATVAAGWSAVYKKALKELEGDPQAEAKAIEKADEAVAFCQPSAMIEDQSALFRESKGAAGEALRAFTQFQSALNVIWQQYTYDMPTALKNREVARFTGILASTILAGVALGLMTDGIDEDDDEKDRFRKFIFWATTQFSDAIPLLGKYTSALSESIIKGEKIKPMADDFFPAVTKLYRGAQSFLGKDWERGLEEIGQGFGYIVGAPVSGAREAGRLLEGDAGAILGRRKE